MRLIGDPERLRWDPGTETTMTWDDAGGARFVDSRLAANAVAAAIECTLQARPGVIGPDAGGGESLVEENERLRGQVTSLQQRNKQLRASAKAPHGQDEAKGGAEPGWSVARVARGVGRRARRLVGRQGS